jgi:hypothetical protein
MDKSVLLVSIKNTCFRCGVVTQTSDFTSHFKRSKHFHCCMDLNMNLPSIPMPRKLLTIEINKFF